MALCSGPVRVCINFSKTHGAPALHLALGAEPQGIIPDREGLSTPPPLSATPLPHSWAPGLNPRWLASPLSERGSIYTCKDRYKTWLWYFSLKM